MDCKHNYIFDEDLEFLKNLSNDDLKLLVDILTKDKDGGQRLTGDLAKCIQNTDYKSSWKCIASELQQYGGDSIANKFRSGKGVKYREILSDICGKFNVEKNDSIDTMESNLLNSFLDKYLKGKDAKFVAEITKNMNIEDRKLADEFIRNRAFLKSIVPIVAQRIITLVAIELATYIVTQRSAWTAFMVLIGQRTVLGPLGPIGWIIGGLLTIPALTGPAYRVTIPACLAITALRRKTHDDLFDDHQNIMNGR